MPLGAGTAGDWGWVRSEATASSEAATGPGICNSKYGKAKRSPYPNIVSGRHAPPGLAPQVTGGGFGAKRRPHQRPRPGRVFATANTERRKGRRPEQSEGRMPLGAVGIADWGL